MAEHGGRAGSAAAADALDPWLRQRSLLSALEALAAGRPPAAPVTVELQLGTECNLACPECICRPLSGALRFDAPRAVAVARELVELGVACVVVSGGGEPLLHPAAGAVLRTLADGGVQVALVTNGTLLHTHLDAVAQGAARVWVSVDAATAATHRRFRPGRAGGAAFDAVLENIRALARTTRGQVTFSFLVLSRRDATTGSVATNAGEIAAAARLARELGCHTFELNLAFDRTPWIDPAHRLVAGTIGDGVRGALELDSGDFRVFVGDLVRDVAAGRADAAPPPRPYARCLAAEIRAVVTPAGVAVCPRHLALPAARYGDPTTTTLGAIWTGPARAAAFAAVDPRRDCAGACMSMALNDRLARAVAALRGGARVTPLPDRDLFL